MTSRDLWNDARDTAVETTRELFAPLTFVVRAFTGGKVKPASGQGGKTKWYGRAVLQQGPHTVESPTKTLRGHRGRNRSGNHVTEPQSGSIRG